LDYHVDYLLTSPDNLRLSTQSHCVSGSATAIIEEIAFSSMRHTGVKEVSLEAAENAVPFYTRLGFHCVNEEDHEFVLSLGTGSLVKFLTAFGGRVLLAG
jgi:hypothetical protein